MKTATLTELALNAEGGVPEWVHLVTGAGAVQAVDGRNWIMRDMAAVVRRSMTGVDLVIDYEHQGDDPKQRVGNGPVPAAGWIKELAARDDGIWGRVEWTQRAREMIGGKEYRYLSPVFTYDEKTREVLRINSAGLVHTPGLRLTALASEQSSEGERANEEKLVLSLIAAALGLSELATSEDVMAAIGKLKAAGAGVPQDVVKDVMRERQDAIATLAEEQVQRKVETALQSGFISPAMRAWATDLCRADPASFEAFCGSAPPMLAHATRSQVNEAFLREKGLQGHTAAASRSAAEIAKTLGIPEDRLR